MVESRWARVRAIFEKACELPTAERDVYLDSACESDRELRDDVAEMLAADERADAFLESPLGSDDALAREGTRIGSFEILRPIAAGGMGTVYEARQESPRRRVALKMMRTGLFSPGAVRRFRYEAEVLARLRHPGIAQVFEAGVHGTQPAGPETPYLALEFVEGAQDLVSFARGRRLTLRAKLELFSTVCAAIHHGHQNGVIHRDIKPANVLVDSDGRVKVIDFGVARTIDPERARQTFATRTGELVGTLQYMSPEQFSSDPLDVDVRSDVYALGVVLYELVCGAAPYDVAGKSIVEIARTVQELPPRRPRERSADVPVELEWILLRALDKEPDRRYSTTSELADDIQRFLSHEPVRAGAPSAVYRLRKFVRRNRILVGASGSVLVALVIGVVVATAGLVEASTEASKFQTINGVLIDTLSSVMPERDGHDVRVLDMLDRTAERLVQHPEESREVRAAIHHTLGVSYQRLGQFAKAEEQQRLALGHWSEVVERGDRERLATVLDLSRALEVLEKTTEARELLEGELPVARRALGATDEVTLGMRQVLAWIPFRLGEYEDSALGLQAVYDDCRAAHGEDHALSLAILMQLSNALAVGGQLEEAEDNYRRLVVSHGRISGAGSFQALGHELALAGILVQQGELEEAEQIIDAALQPLIEIVGEEHNQVLLAMNDLALLYMRQARHAEAESILSDSIAIYERTQGPDYRETLTAKNNLAAVRQALGDRVGSVELLGEVLASRRKIWGPTHERVLATESDLAYILVTNGRTDEALPLAQHCYEARRELLGPDDTLTLFSAGVLGWLHFQREEFEEAAPLFQLMFEGYRRDFGLKDERTLAPGNNLLVCLTRLERYDEAVALSETLVSAQRESLAEDDPTQARLMLNLAELHRERGALAQAEEQYWKTLDHVEEHLPAHSMEHRLAMGDLAICLTQREKYDDAHELFGELLGSWEPDAASRNDHGHYRSAFGRCLLRMERYDEAAQELEVGYEIARDMHGERADETHARVELLVELYEAWGEPETAEEWRTLLKD